MEDEEPVMITRFLIVGEVEREFGAVDMNALGMWPFGLNLNGRCS